MESWEFDVLAALRRAGAPYSSPRPAPPRDAGDQRDDDEPVDRLAARGYVERYPDPEDRRGSSCGGPPSKTAVDAAFEALLEAEKALLADLPAKEQKKLAALLRSSSRPSPDPESAQFARLDPESAQFASAGPQLPATPSAQICPAAYAVTRGGSAASSHSSSSCSFSAASACSSALTSASFS